MYVSELKSIPAVPHWAIITTDSYHVDGDERSRTNPGHGYPAHTITTIAYQAFLDEDEWKAEVAKMSTPRQWFTPKPFKAMKVYPATVQTSVQVNVQT
jgi:hypothetical protein